MSNTSLLGSFGGQGDSSLMFRNRIINGDMRIDQRAAGVSQAITLASVQYLSVDRFLTYQVGAGSTGTTGQVAVTDLPGFSWAQRYTVTSTTDPTAVTVGQRIEGFNIKDLENQLVTISFYIKASRSVNTAVQLFRSGTARSYVKNIAVTTSWVRQTITLTLESILNNANGNGMELLFRHRPDSGALTSTEGSWVDGDKSGITGTTYDFGNTQNDWIEVTGVQFESGTATPFERRPIGVELGMAKRYYEKIPGTAYFVAARSNGGNPTIAISLPQAVDKRTTAPSIQIAGGMVELADSSSRTISAQTQVYGNGFAILNISSAITGNVPVSCYLDTIQVSAEL